MNSNSGGESPPGGDWGFEQLREAYMEGFERNIEAQSAFVEAWQDAVDETMLSEEAMQDSIEGYVGAYEVWMDAAEASLSRMSSAYEGKDVDISNFRDIWLEAANDAFKEIASTQGFATMTGQTVEESFGLRGDFGEIQRETLRNLGVPTESDIDEIGERLLEFERRQHKVEQKLDEVLSALEEE
ncbi:poly(R)-hydroxyalkanoic acid synthase subunit PhaE [Halogeometricum borinquense]|uniref:poly(R)-hydroxyalkanoic acid synthase subunit PhaE n=1 Tax=Halogeometricum borinquense TaxID=60847 RepID=UPI00342A2CF4